MITYLVTYSDGDMETVRGYNIIQALGCVKRGLDNVVKVEKV